MMLDVGYRSTQLRHVDRVGKVEQEIASGYRLRSRDPGRAAMAKISPEPDWLEPIWLAGVVLCHRASPLVAPLDSD
jgi:hypothetical protein